MDSFKTYFESQPQQPIEALVQSLESQYPGLSLFVTQNDMYIHIHEIKLPKNMQSQGIGTKIIQTIQQYAESVGLPITLSPQPEPRMKSKLLKFYKNLGFYNNTGRKKDYSIGSTFGSTWVWRPTRRKDA